MANFRIDEREGLKMVEVTLENETVTAEAGALHYMRGQIELKVPVPSARGFLKAMVTQESVLKPTYTGTGVVYFGPPFVGEFMVMELDNEAWVLDKGAYVCSDRGINIGVVRNKGLTGFTSGEGMFQTKIEGKGFAVIKAQGPLEPIDLVNDKLVVDGSFAVARQASLDFRVQRASKSLIASAASGEGMVNVIEGTGRVYLAPVPRLVAAIMQ